MTTQTDDTRRILEMLSQGKITVDDADRLIQAVSAERAAEQAPADTAADAKPRARWFRINIHKPAKDDAHQPKDVNIRVPIAVAKGVIDHLVANNAAFVVNVRDTGGSPIERPVRIDKWP